MWVLQVLVMELRETIQAVVNYMARGLHMRKLLKYACTTLPEFIPVRCVGDAIQPPHPLTPSSPSALNLSQHFTIFQYKKVKKKKQPGKLCSVKML